MRYTCKTNINELRTSYDYLVGWGAGRMNMTDDII